jgi:uncharacterized protein
MKKMLALVSVLVLGVILSACGPAVAQGVEQPVRTISVTGSSRISLTPDIAHVSIGVQTQDEDAVRAVNDNNAQARQIIDRLKSLGVAERDIRTSNFNIYPNQQYDRDGNVTGITYHVNNSVFVTLRDISKIGEILNETVNVGANNINGISFDVDDKSQAVTEARKSAIADAQAIAREMAQAAGVTLGPVHSISFSGGGYPQPMAYDLMARQTAMDMEVPISTGELSLNVDAYVVYEIR